MAGRTPRRWRRRRSLRARWLLLALAACADDAPLDTLEPKGPEARTIDNLVDPVFLIAGVVFVLVQGGVLFLAWRFRKRKDDDGSLPAAGPRQHQARARLDDPPRPAPRRRRRGVGAHAPRPRRPARPTPWRSPSSGSSGGGSTATTSTATARTTSSPPTTS